MVLISAPDQPLGILHGSARAPPIELMALAHTIELMAAAAMWRIAGFKQDGWLQARCVASSKMAASSNMAGLSIRALGRALGAEIRAPGF